MEHELSHEDALRLNVLLASKPQALRIDESKMTVHGLSPKGEATIVLNPNCRDELYLKRVREMISGHVLGSPGGYPVYLRRWTRMGQARAESLDQLLLLGEPEAVVAVVHAAGLTDEQARRAWWAMPSADNARRMLLRDQVVEGEMGPVLAEYLVEFLPFEEEPVNQIESVRLVLQPGLVSEESVAEIWKKSRHKTAYLVGFLMGRPDDLPEPEPPRADLEEHRGLLQGLAAEGNPYAAQLLKVLDSPGQTWLRVAAQVLRKPANQDVVNLFMDTVADYFLEVRPGLDKDADLARITAEADTLLAGEPLADWAPPRELGRFLEAAPALRDELRAMLILSRLGYPVVRPVFSRTDAIGSLMRRKLEPVTTPILEHMAILRE
jgi:hypothetical protein